MQWPHPGKQLHIGKEVDGRVVPGIGKRTRVDVETAADGRNAMTSQVPGRHTRVDMAARRRAAAGDDAADLRNLLGS